MVALGVLHGHVRAAGMEIDSPHGQIWTFRDGQVVRMRWFNTHREALEAAGVREWWREQVVLLGSVSHLCGAGEQPRLRA